MPNSMEWMWNPFSVGWRSGRARLEYRFQRVITFDPTFGLLSNFYWSFRIPLSMEWMWNP
jgi:hypothetical protein